MPLRLSQPLRRALLTTAGGVGVALLLLIATVPFTGPLGGAAVAALLILGTIVALLAISARDGCSVLTLLVVLLLLVPQDYVLVGPLKSVGNPSVLVALAALAIWAASRVLSLSEAVPLHPVRWVLLAFTIAALTSYAAGMVRDLTASEQASADRVVFPLLGLLGVALLAVDELGTRDRVTTLLQRTVVVGAVAAMVGILEFAFSGFDFREAMRLPGLTANVDLVSDTRSGFERISAGASHPIEFSVVTAALVPLALHFSLHAEPARRWRFTVALVALLVSVPLSVSRAGFLTLAVGFAVYAVALSHRGRINAIVLGVIGLALYRAAVPGLLGTVRSLFFNSGSDPSIEGRTEDYQAIPGLMQGHWWFGRGLGTFVPDVYFFLDNQYLASLLQGGVIGLLALVALVVVGMGVARGVRHRSSDPALRSEGQALVATIAAFAAAAITYDALSFRQSAFLLFLVIGCAGAHWSLVRHRPKGLDPATAVAADPAVAPSRRGAEYS